MTNTLTNNVNVVAAKAIQAAIPELGREEKTLYFLKLTKGEKTITMNVGEKTYNQVKEMTEEEKQTVTQLGRVK